jgi:hypothetical protein
MNVAALAAMANDHVVQLTIHLVLHCSAQASTRGSERAALVLIHFSSSFHQKPGIRDGFEDSTWDFC